MTATYVNNLRIAEPGSGDANWGTTTNASLEIIGEALGIGSEGITTNANTHTSTVADGASDQARAFHLKYTGTLDSACTITIAPNTMKRVQIIENATSGGHSIIISQGSGANVTILNSTKKIIYLDGAGSGAAVVDVTTASFGSQAFYVPAGSTGNRPTGVAGAFRYNSTTSEFEGYTSSWGSIGGSGATNVSLTEATGNGSTTAFTLSTAPGTENNTQVYIDGVYQEKGTYAVSGSTLTFSTAPPNGTSVEVTGFSESSVGTPGDGTVTTAKLANSNVTLAKMAANSVDSDQYVDGSIDTVHIADDQVTGAKLSNNIDIAGTLDVTGLLTADASANVTGNLNILAQGDLRLQDSAGGQYVAMQAPATLSANYTLTLPPDDGDANQYLQTNGSGVLDWATVSVPASSYNAWLVKTSAYTLLTGDQIAANHASTAFTLTLPASPSVGNTVVISNIGAATVTVGRNSQKINSSAQDATLLSNRSTQLTYIDSTIGWKELP